MKAQPTPPPHLGTAIDLFAGAGGSSWGAIQAGVQVVAAVDMWGLAKLTYADNIPGVAFYAQKCEDLDPRTLACKVGTIDLLIASPECTSHSYARGSRAPSHSSLATAFQVTRFARELMPRWVVVENVVQMRQWAGYSRWLSRLASLGYNIMEQVINAADLGVPQSRARLFIMGDLEKQPSLVFPRPRRRRRTIRPVLNLDGKYPFSPFFTDTRSQSSIERAHRAIRTLPPQEPFLLVYYGSDGAGGWQSLRRPLRTVTTVDRFALVRRNNKGRLEIRMLQVPELKLAMGFPPSYRFDHGTRRDKVRLLGNAVCPPVMTAIIEHLVGGGPSSGPQPR